MKKSQEYLLKSLIGWIFVVVFTFVGVIFLALGGYEFWQGLKTKDWPAAPGTILESEIESKSSTSRSSRRGSRRDTDYRVKLRYSFEVAGQKLEGTRLQYGDKSHDERSTAMQEKSRYPVGKEVQVYYDPTNPISSVLVKGIGTSWRAIVLGLLALVLGIVSMAYIVGLKRTGARENLHGS